MAAEKRKIFVGSTAKDLQLHRQRIREIIESFGYFEPLMMKEHFGPGETDAITISSAYVDQADIYIGIFARRYGYVQEKNNADGLSVTEMEYHRATQNNIPRLCFVLPEEEAWFSGANYVESNAAAATKLRAFKERVQKDVVSAPFTSRPESLDIPLRASLSKIKEVISLPFAVLAMTQDEFKGFWNPTQAWQNDVNAERQDPKLIAQLKKAIKSAKIEESRLLDCYGARRADWKPSGDIFSMTSSEDAGVSIEQS